jgi:hypothetical protein
MNLEHLRAAYRRGVLQVDRPGCPAPDELLALVGRRLPEARRLQLLDHVMACRTCQADYELLRTAAEAADRTAGPVPSRAAGWRRWAVAAAAVLAVGSAAIWGAGRLGWSRDEVPRGGAGEVVLVTPNPGARIAALERFVWRPVPDAVSYRLEVLGPGGDVLVAAETADTVLRPAPDPGWPAGVELSWWVTARLAGGGERRSSIGRFTVR